ncbi:MAG: archease [Acidobacteria bacterium]|nr:archease [Acidobacteriota bacterium]
MMKGCTPDFESHMERGYEFLKHTADAKFRAWGPTLEEAFEEAASAMLSLMWDVRILSRTRTVEKEFEGKDHHQLLLQFLEEILYLLDARSFLVVQAQVVEMGETKGRPWLRSRYSGMMKNDETVVHGEVKAVTYSEMDIHLDDAKAVVQVVVDL